jgi:hypothetical protein
MAAASGLFSSEVIRQAAAEQEAAKKAGLRAAAAGEKNDTLYTCV